MRAWELLLYGWFAYLASMTVYFTIVRKTFGMITHLLLSIVAYKMIDWYCMIRRGEIVTKKAERLCNDARLAKITIDNQRQVMEKQELIIRNLRRRKQEDGKDKC